jgi:hypothetical protein
MNNDPNTREDALADEVPEFLDEDGAPEAAPGVETPARPAKPGGPLRFARMAGSSIAGRDAAPWVTDFLNAAYYRRPVAEREVDDLRLAFSILTTYWYRTAASRRLHMTDLRAFHAAFGSHRFDTEQSDRGVLDRGQLAAGGAALIGDWFPAAYEDAERRGWGIAFQSPEERAAYDHERRLALARLGRLTPEQAPAAEQVWHTYPPVEMPSVEAVVGALTRPETWPDYASEVGRFTPLRPGGLEGQAFEIEVAAGTESGRPIFTRGYVTITRLVTPDDPAALRAYFDEVEAGFARYGDNARQILPDGAEPLVGFDLTTHQGHFMGSGHNRLVLYVDDGRPFVRAAGTWDPMPWHLDRAYRIAGRDAQHAFWGEGDVARLSMLHQLALRIGG